MGHLPVFSLFRSWWLTGQTVGCNQEKIAMMHAALGIWILSAVICAGRGHHHEGHVQATDQTDQDTAPETSVSKVQTENKDFAFRLYRKLVAQADSEGKNIFFSPASVSLALAALSVGTRGETHRQLFSGLGYNNSLLTQADVDQAYQTILENSKTSSEDISEGTAVFVDDKFKALPQFLDTLRESYLTEGFNIDFTKTKESADTINQYVGEKTNGKIDKMVDSLDESTIMYLLSYIYYKGKWENPFDPELTREDVFMVDENTKVPVQMMYMQESFDIYQDLAINTSVLHLPFNNSYSMLLLLPEDMATLESTICPGHIAKWLKWMKPKTYRAFIPKFSIKSSFPMKGVLTEMGMTDMFGDRADLSGIAEGQKLVVSEVVHKATLDVDETGATAAAATGITITLLSFRYIPVLRFDRPFMVVIVERNTQNILFMGKIINPNK